MLGWDDQFWPLVNAVSTERVIEIPIRTISWGSSNGLLDQDIYCVISISLLSDIY